MENRNSRGANILAFGRSLFMFIFFKKQEIDKLQLDDTENKKKICYKFKIQLRKGNPLTWLFIIIFGLPIFGIVGLNLFIQESINKFFETKVELKKTDKLKWWHGFENLR